MLEIDLNFIVQVNIGYFRHIIAPYRNKVFLMFFR